MWHWYDLYWYEGYFLMLALHLAVYYVYTFHLRRIRHDSFLSHDDSSYTFQYNISRLFKTYPWHESLSLEKSFKAHERLVLTRK